MMEVAPEAIEGASLTLCVKKIIITIICDDKLLYSDPKVDIQLVEPLYKDTPESRTPPLIRILKKLFQGCLEYIVGSH